VTVLSGEERRGWIRLGLGCLALALAAAPRIFPPAPPGQDPAADSIDLRSVPVNRADGETLATLPGIGPVLAGRILHHRERHGPFRDLADLEEVPGIGPARARAMAPYVLFD
jgi:competence protein ComEA